MCVCTHALLFPHDRKGSKLECRAPFTWILSYYSSVSKIVFILIVYLRRRISQKSGSLFLKLKCAGQSQRLLLRHRFWFCSIGARPEFALLMSSQVLPGPLAQATLWAGAPAPSFCPPLRGVSAVLPHTHSWVNSWSLWLMALPGHSLKRDIDKQLLFSCSQHMHR